MLVGGSRSSQHDGGWVKTLGDRPPESLLEDVVHDSDKAWRRWARSGVLAFFALVLLAAALGAFDLGTQRTAALGTAEVGVDYPVTTRAGLDLKVIVKVSDRDGLPETLRIEIDQEYLDMFEDLLLVPEPSDQTALRGGIVRFEYELPAGSTHARLSIEGRASDRWEPSTSGTIRLVGSDGFDVGVPVTTWRLP